MNLKLHHLVIILIILLVGLTGKVGTATEKPNIILVMADDLGIGDISPTNPDCQISTPRLQELADAGLTFLDAHTTS